MGKKLLFESKLNALYNKIMITESRKENLNYEEKKAKGVIDSIIVKVTGSSADKINRLVEGIEQTRDLIDEYTAKSKELTAEAKSYSAEFFDESDKVFTRVIESNKSIIKFSKVVPKLDKKTNKDFDKLEKLIGDIAALIGDQQDAICDQIRSMIDGCVWITETEEMKLPAEKVTTKSVVSEGIKELTEGFIVKLKNKVKSWISKLNTFVELFDKKQKKINFIFEDLI